MAEKFNSKGQSDERSPYHPADEYAAVQLIQEAARQNFSMTGAWDLIDTFRTLDDVGTRRCARELLPFYFLNGIDTDLP